MVPSSTLNTGARACHRLRRRCSKFIATETSTLHDSASTGSTSMRRMHTKSCGPGAPSPCGVGFRPWAIEYSPSYAPPAYLISPARMQSLQCAGHSKVPVGCGNCAGSLLARQVALACHPGGGGQKILPPLAATTVAGVRCDGPTLRACSASHLRLARDGLMHAFMPHRLLSLTQKAKRLIRKEERQVN